ncbi:Aste57867_22405 [Aphanomyces stellatus]|uniref:Aste57867_22405 protein n=1 Tax=Aphanomyces stellatus TaxID=120398 RepID=A0A485LJZ4_9STRA|nr:hypothetical protein As57867_022335 [Aphanomyces stellatus]VFT99068.1 Aste57867_22405 [Aphanomyces stellatus]
MPVLRDAGGYCSSSNIRPRAETHTSRSLPMVEEVRVTVVRATRLVGNDGFGANKTSDPFVELTLLRSNEELVKGTAFKTRDVQKTVNPLWNETFVFGKDVDLRSAHYLCCTIFDKNFLKNVPLGRVLVLMDDVRSCLQKNSRVEQSYPVTKFGSMKVATGDLVLAFEPNDGAPSAAAGHAAVAAPGSSGVDRLSDESQGTGPPNVLRVTVESAANLPAMDKGGTSDPLVIISCNKTKLNTTTKLKTLSCMWNESFKLPVEDPNQFVLFVVEDFDATFNDFIGQVKVPLESLQDGKKQTLTLPLLDKKFRPKDKLGSITVSLHWIHVDNVSAVVASNKKKHVGLFGQITNAIAGVPDAGDEDEEGVDADALENKPPPSKSPEELKKEQEEKEKARAEELKVLQDIVIKSGDYSVQVHVIEARDLAPKDATGTSDPVVYVDVMDQQQNTAVKPKTLNAVWDDVLIFTFRDLDKEKVEMGAIKVSVMDANTIQRAELIGETKFDVSFIYAKINHQICTTWVGLCAPGQDGVQGYVRLSITIVGPGDKFVAPPPIDPSKTGMGDILMPLSVKQEVSFLVCAIHVGQDLPPMDSVSVLGQKLKQGIDAYVSCELVGGAKPIRTRVKTKNGERHQLCPAFNDELWLVLREPSLANKVVLVVKDWDRLASDEIVAHSYHSLRLIKKMCSASDSGTFGPMWLNLYGAPLNFTGNIIPGENSAKNQMNTFPDLGTFYRGRILVSFSIRSNERHLDEINQRVKAVPLPRQIYPETVPYKLRAFVGTGTDIPQMTSLSGVGTRNSKMQIVITCGLYELAFERRENTKGLVVWNQLLESDTLILPKDPTQIPDIFVYLTKGKVEGKLQGRKQVSYRRFTAKTLLGESMEKEPHWMPLKEDSSVDALSDDEFPGNIFINLGFGTEETAARTKKVWEDVAKPERLAQRYKYHVRVNVYQGRQLPAMDDNGLSDPYIKVRFCGEEKKIAVKKQTCNPLWYQTVTFNVDLPPVEMLHFAPQVILRVVDWDAGLGDTSHDYIGSSFLTISPTDARELNDARPDPSPKWHHLVQQEEGDTEGEILASVAVVKLDRPDAVVPPPPSIVPKTRTAYLELIVLGLRDMRPFQFLPIQLPFVDFNLGNTEHANQEMRTEKSKRPSGANPNFLQRIVREVELPEDSLFAPMLNILVKDTRLGGWYTPLIGSSCIDVRQMSTKLPWGKGYIPPQSLDLGSIAEPDDDDGETEATPLMTRHMSVVKHDVGAGVFGALELMGIDIDLSNPSLLTDEGIRSTTLLMSQLSMDEDDDGAADEYEAKRKKYMKNRQDLSDELESETLTTKPFETYKLMTGQKKKKKSLFSLLKIGGTKSKAAEAANGSGTFHVAGIFKGLVRVMLKENDPPLVDLTKLLNPQPYIVRVYILNGEGFQPMDPGFDGKPGKSDPYMVLRLGKAKINDRKNYIDDVVDPDFYKLFEINCEFPGASTLHLDSYDFDLIGGDDLIGSSSIDLEDRFFDKNWQALGEEFKTSERWGPKPVEQRTLYVPTSRAPMGQLKLWIDILSPKDAAVYPPVDIALPPPVEFELRVVVWKTKEVPNFDEFTEMNDLFVRCQLEGSDYQDTDIHWRAKKGKASFNWRMKFPVTLGHKQHNSKFPYFKMQMWDKDIFSANDCIAEGILDMTPHFKQVCKLKAPLQVFQDKTPKPKVKETAAQQKDNDAIRSIKEATGLWDTDPVDSTWIKMERLNRDSGVKEPMGAVCISMELTPIAKAKVQHVGFGRSDPNNNPFLPPPAGRLKFSMNPFYVFNELLGPKICRRFMCCLCCVLVAVAMYFLGPFMNLAIVLLK